MSITVKTSDGEKEVSSPCAGCDAPCCYHDWPIRINSKEYDSGLYAANITREQPFGHEKYFLEKDASHGGCVHFDREHHTCSIYADRPLTCREYECVASFGRDGFPVALLGEYPHLCQRVLEYIGEENVSPRELFIAGLRRRFSDDATFGAVERFARWG